MVRKQVDDDEVAELYRSGMSQREVAAKFGVSASTISASLRRTLTPTRGRSQVRTAQGVVSQQAVDELVEQLYRDGMPPRDIRDELGISPTQVTASLRRTNAAKGVDHAQLRDRYRNGEDVSVLAKEFNIDVDYAIQLLREGGVPIRGEKFDPDDARMMFILGDDPKTIAEKLDTDVRSVRKVLRESDLLEAR